MCADVTEATTLLQMVIIFECAPGRRRGVALELLKHSWHYAAFLPRSFQVLLREIGRLLHITSHSTDSTGPKNNLKAGIFVVP